jgi:hypothetical protein
MKKLTALFSLIVLTSAATYAQNYDFNQYAGDFKTFSSAFAKVLPFNSTIGLQWSNAYIGQLIDLPPHFGVGATVGFTGIPMKDVNPIIDKMGVSVPSAASPYTSSFGLPIPATDVEARIGGIILPFDFGVKFMTIPGSQKAAMKSSTGMDFDYTLFGLELRVPLVREKFFIPSVSVGLGYNHMEGNLGMPMPNTSPFSYTMPDSTVLEISQPELAFKWTTDAVDLNLQISKNVFWIITPYLGTGITFGKSNAGGGLNATVSENGQALSSSEISALNSALSKVSGAPSINSEGIYYMRNVTGTSFRVFGGLSLNVLIIKLDLAAMYNVTGGNLGAQGNVRVQL